jgi:hypothetical protein
VASSTAGFREQAQSVLDMSLFAQLTATALLVPLAFTPPAVAFARVQAPEAAPPAAAPPAAAAPPVAAAPPAAAPPAAVAPSPMAPVAVAPSSSTVVAPSGSTVVVSDGSPTTIVTPNGADVATTTTTTTTTTATTTTVSTTAPPAAPVISPKAAVKNLLRYDPYLAPRYRSGRNMMIGGGVMLGVGTLTLLYTLAWASHSRERLNHISIADERRRAAEQRNQYINVARVVGVVAAATALTGIVLLAVGSVRKRRAIEEARGRVFMQAGPGGMQVRF